MKINVETLAKSEVKLTIELDAKAMEAFAKQAAKELQDQVKVDGFRAGHIPLDVLKNKVGEQAFLSAVVDLAISKSYEDAIKKEKILPVAYPKINVLEQDPLKYEATVAVVPEVEIKKDFDKLTVKAEKIEVKAKEIDEVLENLGKQMQKWEDVDRAAKKGDRVEIDFDGFDEGGAALDGTSSKNHPLVLGSNSFIPGFEDEVIGLKKEDKKEFQITFPKGYHAKPFQNKKVTFKIRVGRIEEAVEQKLDDDFAKELTGGKHTELKSLREEIKEELTHKKEDEAQGKLETEFLEKLVDYVKADVPQALIDREKAFLLKRLEEDLKRQNMTLEQYKGQLKDKEKKDLDKELEEQAHKQILIRLGLEKVYEMEKIEVKDSDIQAEVDHMLSHYPPAYHDQVKENFKKGGQAWDQLANRVQLSLLVKKHTKTK